MPEEPTPPTPTEPKPTKTQPAASEPGPSPQPTATEPGPAGTEAIAPGIPVLPDTGYTNAGVPTFDGVREKIETRYGTALGATELAEDTPEGRTAAQQFDARQKAAEDKLAKIRASMKKPD